MLSHKTGSHLTSWQITADKKSVYFDSEKHVLWMKKRQSKTSEKHVLWMKKRQSKTSEKNVLWMKKRQGKTCPIDTTGRV